MNPEDSPADKPPLPSSEQAVTGARWAAGLGAALLAALALLTGTRWVGKPSAAAEEIVQIPPATATPTPLPPEFLAPDPGDHP